MSYVTGALIRTLREKKGYTQRELAEKLQVSDKTVSKWETDRGLPDIGIIGELASALGVSLAELLTGELAENMNRAGNMKKVVFYLCPVCGNIIQATGNGAYSCCGIQLPALEAESSAPGHEIQVESADGELYVTMDHDMTKEHYISFMAYVTGNQVQMIKLYPEQEAECRFIRRGHGIVYAYCNRDGLVRKLV